MLLKPSSTKLVLSLRVPLTVNWPPLLAPAARGYTPGTRNARSLKSRPLSGISAISCEITTSPFTAFSVFSSGTSAVTSTVSEMLPGSSRTSRRAAWPTSSVSSFSTRR